MARHGLFLGIDHYTRSLGELQGAEDDARDMADLFQNQLGYNAVLLLRERDRPAILERLQQLENKLQPGDTFVFYFSGHGVQRNEQQYFLLPRAELADLNQGEFSDTLPYETLLLRTAKPRWQGVTRVFIFDACRAEPGQPVLKSGGNLPGFATGWVEKRPVLAAAPNPAANNYTVINSCSDGQCAIEDPDAGRGLFTTALLAEMRQQLTQAQALEINPAFLGRVGQRIRQRMQESGYGLREQSPRFTGQPVLLYQPSAPGKQEAVRQAGEHQWKLLQVDLGLQSDAEEKIRLLRSYIADPHCTHFDEASQQIKTLADELAAQRQRLEAQQAQVSADAQAWQKTQAAVTAARSPTDKRAALRSYAEQWEMNRVEALAQISALDQQIKAEEAQQARISADAQAWQNTLAAVAAASSPAEKRAALASYANQWEINRVEALAQISALDQQIRDGQKTPRAEANSAAKAGHTSAPDICETFTVNGVSFKMVAIPAGSFMMGSPESEPGRMEDEGPLRQVTIQAFQLGQTQVTQGLWQAVMGNNPSSCKNSGANAPVEMVSWDDAQGFIKILNQLTGQVFRLPSEAEWEYAARAGCTTPFNVGGQCRDKIETSEANFNGSYTYNGSAKGEYRGKTLPVASFAANGFGLFDMHGNVWEWVQDYHVDSYAGAPSDGGAVEKTVWYHFLKSHVYRGGSWLRGPEFLRAAQRYYFHAPVRRDVDTGFRLARTLP